MLTQQPPPKPSIQELMAEADKKLNAALERINTYDKPVSRKQSLSLRKPSLRVQPQRLSSSATVLSKFEAGPRQPSAKAEARRSTAVAWETLAMTVHRPSITSRAEVIHPFRRQRTSAAAWNTITSILEPETVPPVQHPKKRPQFKIQPAMARPGRLSTVFKKKTKPDLFTG